MMSMKKPRDGQRWLWASSITILCLGGFISTSPIIGKPIHVYAAALLAIALSAAVLRKFWRPGAGWIIAVWATFAFAALVHPSTTEYGQEKFVQLFTATLLATVAPLWLLHNERRQQTLIYCLYLFAGIVTTLAIVFPEHSGRLSLVGTNYIGSGRILCLFFAISLLFFGLKVGPRPASLVLVAISGYAAFQTESRGPLLAAVAAMVVVLLFRVDARSTRVLRIVGGFFAVLCMLVVVLPTQIFQDSRFAGLTNPDQNVASRLSFYSDAFQLGLSNPAGVGWGNLQLHLSDQSIATGGDTLYPHNVLLEVWAEGGWPATALLLAFVIASLRKMQRSSWHTTAAVLWGITLFFLINAMVSADINGNRILFGLLALAWGLDTSTDQSIGGPHSRRIKNRLLRPPESKSHAPLLKGDL